MELLRGNADLRAESELAAVCKACGYIVIDCRGIHIRHEEVRRCRIFGHAFPKDTFNGNVIDALRQNGALYARRVSRQRPKDFSLDRSSLILMPTCRHCDPFADELLSEFISAPAGRDDMVFVMWGHSYELDYGTSLACWEHIERMFQALSRAKDIEFVTNRELYGT